MTHSAVPAVLDALQTVATTALPDLQIGVSNLLETEHDFLIIAADDPEQNTAGVTGVRANGDMAGVSDSETVDVSCVLSTWIGDADVATVQVRLFELLDMFDAAIESDRSIGLVNAEYVQVTDFALQQAITGEGAVATLRFTVHVDAWRQ